MGFGLLKRVVKGAVDFLIQSDPIVDACYNHKSTATAYSDQDPAGAASGKKPHIFEKRKHRKHLATVYFQDSDNENELKPMIDPPAATKESKEAYSDFLKGLDLINQQEYIYEQFAKKRRIKSEEVDHWFDDSISPKPTQHDTWYSRAEWEREMVRRQNAFSEDLFLRNLKERAKGSKYVDWFDPTTTKAEDEGMEKMTAPPIFPPIRSETYKLLTRPPEPDFSFFGYLITIMNIMAFGWNLYSQVNALSLLCSGPFICSSLPYHPLPAPPVALRTKEKSIFVGVDGISGSFRRMSCNFSRSGCSDPGYKVEWPYVQIAANSSALHIPPNLLTKCQLIKGRKNTTVDHPNLFADDDEGWVWDPFKLTVRDEYLDCSQVCGGSVSSCLVPFEVDDVAFHFDTRYYHQNHKAVKGCLRTFYLIDGLQNVSIFDEVASDHSLQKVALSDKSMRVCMATACVDTLNLLSQLSFDVLGGCPHFSDMDQCKCAPKGAWSNWAVRDFYSASSPRQSMCEGGKNNGHWCISDMDCRGQKSAELGNCVPMFPGQIPLNQSAKYGCFFENPVSSEVQPVVNLCAVYNVQTSYSGSTYDLVRSRASMSTRDAFIFVFLIKEGCYLTAIGTMFILSLVTVLILVVISPFVSIAYVFRRRQTILAAKIVVYALAPFAIMIWTIALNLSTFYRGLCYAYILYMQQVNPSIKDYDIKITEIANIMFNLMVLIGLNSGDINLFASLILSVTFMLLQMIMEKISLGAIASTLTDLNEMRLTKFEFALFIIKISEDFLNDDVHYNFVRHFYSRPDQPGGRLLPDLHPLDASTLTKPLTLEECGIALAGAGVGSFLSELTDKFQRQQSCVEEMVAAEKKVLTRRNCFLSNHLVDKYGHDGRGNMALGKWKKVPTAKPTWPCSGVSAVVLAEARNKVEQEAETHTSRGPLAPACSGLASKPLLLPPTLDDGSVSVHVADVPSHSLPPVMGASSIMSTITLDNGRQSQPYDHAAGAGVYLPALVADAPTQI